MDELEHKHLSRGRSCRQHTRIRTEPGVECEIVRTRAGGRDLENDFLTDNTTACGASTTETVMCGRFDSPR